MMTFEHAFEKRSIILYTELTTLAKVMRLFISTLAMFSQSFRTFVLMAPVLSRQNSHPHERKGVYGSTGRVLFLTYNF